MWRMVRKTTCCIKSWQCRIFSASSCRYAAEYEGDWTYSSEWWKDHDSDSGRTVFKSHSKVGNGVVSVVAYPSSRPVSIRILMFVFFLFLSTILNLRLTNSKSEQSSSKMNH